jgi:hypothetical protein
LSYYILLVLLDDNYGHIALGEDVQGATSAIIDAKINLLPVIRVCYMNKIGLPHSIPCKETVTGGDEYYFKRWEATFVEGTYPMTAFNDAGAVSDDMRSMKIFRPPPP